MIGELIKNSFSNAKFISVGWFDFDSNTIAGEGIVLPDSYRAPLRPGGGAGVPGMVKGIKQKILSFE